MSLLRQNLFDSAEVGQPPSEFSIYGSSNAESQHNDAGPMSASMKTESREGSIKSKSEEGSVISEPRAHGLMSARMKSDHRAPSAKYEPLYARQPIEVCHDFLNQPVPPSHPDPIINMIPQSSKRCRKILAEHPCIQYLGFSLEMVAPFIYLSSRANPSPSRANFNQSRWKPSPSRTCPNPSRASP